MNAGRARRAATDEHGAVAVMIAFLMVVIVGMAAFAVDLGAAYTNKRQLSIGADAAALAAAQSYANQPIESCADMLASAGKDSPTPLDLANTYAEDNTPGKVKTTWDPRCGSDGTQLLVTYGNSRQIDSIFGGIFGTSHLGAEQEATAATEALSQAPGLVPYALCASDLETALSKMKAANATISGAYISYYPNDTCSPHTAGNWYTVDCPGVGNNANGTIDQPGSLAYNTAYGCSEPISIIGSLDASTLKQACTATSTNTPDPHQCLGSNTGNLASNNLAEAWSMLQDKKILVPVFVKDSILGKGGNTWTYPVAAVASIYVCGYHWVNNGNSWMSSDPNCTDYSSAQEGVTPTKDWLVWRLTVRYVDAPWSTTPTCKLGDSCDLGVRTINLVK